MHYVRGSPNCAKIPTGHCSKLKGFHKMVNNQLKIVYSFGGKSSRKKKMRETLSVL